MFFSNYQRLEQIHPQTSIVCRSMLRLTVKNAKLWTVLLQPSEQGFLTTKRAIASFWNKKLPGVTQTLRKNISIRTTSQPKAKQFHLIIKTVPVGTTLTHILQSISPAITWHLRLWQLYHRRTRKPCAIQIPRAIIAMKKLQSLCVALITEGPS